MIGFSINMLTMVALLIAIGLMMDDAIVIAENVAARMKAAGISFRQQDNSFLTCSDPDALQHPGQQIAIIGDIVHHQDGGSLGRGKREENLSFRIIFVAGS